MTDTDLREAMIEWLTDKGYEGPNSFNVYGRHKLGDTLTDLVEDALDELDHRVIMGEA